MALDISCNTQTSGGGEKRLIEVICTKTVLITRIITRNPFGVSMLYFQDSDLSKTNVFSARITNFTRISSISFFVAFMKTFQDANVLCDFCAVRVRGIERSAILVPRSKDLGSSSECALKFKFLSRRNANIFHLCHKLRWAYKK